MDSLTELAARADCELLSAPRHGGSASVHRARCLRSNRVVALKLLHPGRHPGRHPDRLREEVATLARLDHPSIVETVRSGHVDGAPFLMTAWIEGVSLRQLLAGEAGVGAAAFSLDRSLSLLAPLFDALCHAHSRGVVHGDLTPGNVLVTPLDRSVLIDFGNGVDVEDTTVTVGGELAGTPRYLAPELIRGAAPSPSSDQYAAALLGYEMLTGCWPFPSHSTAAAAALHHQLYTTPAPVSEHRPDLPGAVDDVFDRALAKAPDARFPTVRAFADALARCAVASSAEGPCAASGTRRASVGFGRRSLAEPVPARRVGWRTMTGLVALCLLTVGMTPSSSRLTSSRQSTPSNAPPAPGTPSSDLSLASNTTSLATIVPSSFDTDARCNRFPNPYFDTALESNFYRDPDNPDAATRIDTRSSGRSPSLQLGSVNVYGLYGVIVDVEGGREYGFGASLSFEGYVHRAELRIVWLDAEWQTLPGADATAVIDDKVDGRHALARAVAPVEARHAVPTIYKDASAGILHADDVMFAPLRGRCFESLERSTP